MANEIKLVTYANSEVTPQNDAVLTNLEIASNGVIFGCNVTIKNASTLHINAGMGVVYGREFEIVDSDIPVSLSSSGTLLGQLYVHIDLANSSEPAQLLVDTGNSLTPLVDDPTINITTGSTDYQLATFTVDTSTLANLTETFSIVQNPTSLIGNTDISGIGDGTLTGAVSQLNTDIKDATRTNLLNPTAQTQTTNGVTFTNNGDGTYTVNGTASNTAYCQLADQFTNLVLSRKYKLVGCPQGGGYNTYLLYDDKNVSMIDTGNGIVYTPTNQPKLFIRIMKGTTVNNLIFKPMLTTDLNATYDDFVRYTGTSGKLNEDVAQLNTDLTWKHLGTYAFNTNASLPASYDEICLIAKQSNDTNGGICPMVIPKISLQVSAGIFSNGASNVGAGGSTHIMLEISQTTAKLTRYRYNSSTDITTSVLDIYYK